MRPLRLEMKGLRSYRERVKLDLSGRDLLAIVGDTGSGKSSILEAIVFALYNGTTWGGRETSSLISGEGDGTMSVTLEFAADGKLWRVSRRISEGSSPPSMHRLECLTPGEDGFEALNGATQVDRQVEELVGLTRSAFVTSVILPQGRFQDLLHASGTEKTGILKGIFRLSAIGILRGRARDRREEEHAEENGLLEERTRFMPDPAGTIEESARLEGELAPRLENLRASYRVAEDAAERLSRISSERESLARRGGDLEGAADRASGVAEGLSSLLGLAEAYEGEEETLLSGREEARAAHEEAGREREQLLDGGIGPDELLAALYRARALPGKLEELRALGDGVERGEAGLGGTRGDLAVAISEHESAANIVSSRRGQRDGARRKEGEIRDAAGRLERNVADLGRTRKDLEAVEENLGRALAALERASEGAKERDADHRGAEGRYLDHVRSESGLKVAALAHPGEPCPVCERELPEGFSGPSEGEVEREERLLEDAREDLGRLRRELDETRGEVRTYEERVSRLDADRERLSREADAARAELGRSADELVGLGALSEAGVADPENLEPEGIALEARRALEAVEAALEEASRIEGEARLERERLAGEVGLTEERMRQDRELLERGVDGFLAEIGSLPPFVAVRPGVPVGVLRSLTKDDVPEEELLRAAHKIEARLSQVRGAEELERRLFEELCAKKDDLERFRERRERELLAPAREAAGALHGPYHAVEAAARMLREIPDPDGADGREPTEEPEEPPAPGRALADLLGYAAGLAAQARGLVEGIGRRCGRLEAAEGEHSARLNSALNEAGAQTIEGLLEQKGDVEYRLRRAREERERAERELPEVERISAAVEESRRKREAYGALHELLAQGKFESYAAANRQRQLLGVASDIFGEMTDGAYGFAADFAVIHRPTGQRRPSKTLSGGETFLASLALALGLMEIAGRSGGRLEAFFMDEGFGSLDPNALDRALAELARRARGGRMVALVSHVPEVADYVRGHGHVLRVCRDASGSSVILPDEEDAGRGPAENGALLQGEWAPSGTSSTVGGSNQAPREQP